MRKFNLRNCHWKFWNAYEVRKKNDDFFKIQENICLMLLLISIELDCFFLMWSLRASSPHIRVYSTELCPAAPREFCQSFRGRAGRSGATCFCGAGRGNHPCWIVIFSLHKKCESRSLKVKVEKSKCDIFYAENAKRLLCPSLLSHYIMHNSHCNVWKCES